MKIALVEDNLELQEELSFQLGCLGYTVMVFSDASSFGQALIDGTQFHLVLLDLGLPDIDGIDLLSWLRESYPFLPVVITTARESVASRIEGWEAGADAYLIKPIAFEELKAVIKSLLQRQTAEQNSSTWYFDRLSNKLSSGNGITVELTVTERALVECLVATPGEPVTRDSLIASLGADAWEYDQRRLEAAVSRLRRKLYQLSGGENVLKASRGNGYLLSVEIKIDS